MRKIIYIITRIVKYGMMVVLSIAGLRDLAKAFMFPNPVKNVFWVLIVYSIFFTIVNALMDKIASL